MKRVLLVCLILVGMIGLVASVWLRLEMAAPGISALARVAPDPRHLFDAAVLAQSLAMVLWPPLMAALAGLVAGNREGQIAAAGAVLAAGVAIWAASATDWTGIASPASPADWQRWLGHPAFRPVLWLSVCLLPAAAMLADSGWRRPGALTVMILAVAVPAMVLSDLNVGGLSTSLATLALPAAALAVLATVTPQNPATVWLGFGAVMVATAAGVAPRLGAISAGATTYYMLGPLGPALTAFTVFLALATLAAWLHPRLPLWLSIATAAALALAMTAATAPQLFLGSQGTPRRYIDYPAAFALWNLVSAVGALATPLFALAAATAMILRRTRAA